MKGLTEADIRGLRDIAAGKWPMNGHDVRRRVRLKSKGLAERELYHPWTWSLTDAGRAALQAAPAPPRQADEPEGVR